MSTPDPARQRFSDTLAGLVAARLCHDLASPLGAIANGVDLIEEIGPTTAGEEFALLVHSARRASALLAFHRLVFARPRNEAAPMPRKRLCTCVSAALEGPRVTVEWEGLDGPALPPASVRLLTRMLLSGRALLGLGGRLLAQLSAGDALPAAVVATGENISLSQERRRWLGGEIMPLPEPREVEFVLLPLAAREAESHVEVIEEPGRITLHAVPKRPRD